MIFEYKCKECEYIFEDTSSIDNPIFIICPKCSGETEKLFHATSNVFIPAYFHTSKSDIFDYQEWQDLKKNPNIERAR